MICLDYKEGIQNNKTGVCRCFVVFYNGDIKLILFTINRRRRFLLLRETLNQ